MHNDADLSKAGPARAMLQHLADGVLESVVKAQFDADALAADGPVQPRQLQTVATRGDILIHAELMDGAVALTVRGRPRTEG